MRIKASFALAALAAGVLAFAQPSLVRADGGGWKHTITFDDVTTDLYAPLDNTYYQGVYWSANFGVLNATDVGTFDGPSGYTNGLVSPDYVAFNSFERDVFFYNYDQAFDLNSLYLTGAWNDGLTVEIYGYSFGGPSYFQSVTVDSTAPTFVDLEWGGVRSVAFRSYGGVDAGYFGQGTQFALDNVTITQIPEPGIVVTSLTLFGGLGLGLLKARRRRK